MLYVSREVSDGKYAVMDTDDMTEQEVSAVELRNMVSQWGLSIKGCTESGQIRVYSPSAELARLNTLRGVQLDVRDGVLCAIDFHTRPCNVTVRLSDFCSAVRDRVLYGASTGNGIGLVTLVLDDNVKIQSATSFIMARDYPIKFNLFEVTNDNEAHKVYVNYMDTVIGKNRAFGFPIDDKFDRYCYHCAEQLMHMSLTMSSVPPKRDLPSDTYILLKYKNRFMQYENTEFHWVSTNKLSIFSKTFGISVETDAFTERCLSSNTYISSFGRDLVYCSTLNKTDMILLTNYMKYWGTDKDIQKVWLNLSKQAVKLLVR